MKRAWITGLVSAALVGCGGGGSDSGAVVAPPAASTLAKYVGAYGGCDGHEKITVTVAARSDTEVTLEYRSDYYQETNCAGAVVAVETMTAPITATFISTAPAQVTGYPTDKATGTYAVDRVNLAAPATTTTMTGSGVRTIGGKTCVVYTNGQTCLDATSNPAASIVGGLALTDGVMLFLLANGAGYTLDSGYRKL